MLPYLHRKYFGDDWLSIATYEGSLVKLEQLFHHKFTLKVLVWDEKTNTLNEVTRAEYKCPITSQREHDAR